MITTTIIAAASLLSPADVADVPAAFNSDSQQEQAYIQTVTSPEGYNIKMGLQGSFSYVPTGGGQVVDDWN